MFNETVYKNFKTQHISHFTEAEDFNEFTEQKL